MDERRGVVTRVLDKDRVVVRVCTKDKCQTCPLASLCSLGKEDEEVIEARGEGLLPGDIVVVEEGEGKLILFAFLLFILPLFFFLSGYLIFRNFFTGEAIPALLGFGIMLFYFLILGIIERKLKDRLFLPQARKID